VPPGTADDYADSYVYDLVGNRKEFTHAGTTTYYFCNNADHLLKETSDAAGTNILISYLYDDNGSLTQKAVTGGDTTVYTYNLQNRMDSVTVGSGPMTSYVYDPDGVRIEKKVGSSNPIRYLVDHYNHTGYPQVFKQTQSGSSDVAYVIGHDVLAQATGANNPVYMLYDGHGSVRHLSDNTGSQSLANSCGYRNYFIAQKDTIVYNFFQMRQQ
jgi:YD repeat-containing protein